MTEMTLDDALLWLNDRLGRRVSASINLTLDRGEVDSAVLIAAGELRHWSQRKRDKHMAGVYRIGDGSLDLRDIRPLEVMTLEEEEEEEDFLSIRLNKTTTLNVWVEED